jgi:hypothetical protein
VNSYVEHVGALAAARRCAISCSRSWPLQRVTTTSRHQPIKLNCQSARSRAVQPFRRRRTKDSQYPVYMGVSKAYPLCRKPLICSTDPDLRAREHQIVSSPPLRWRAPTDPLTTQTPVSSLHQSRMLHCHQLLALCAPRSLLPADQTFCGSPFIPTSSVLIMNNFVGSE